MSRGKRVFSIILCLALLVCNMAYVNVNVQAEEIYENQDGEAEQEGVGEKQIEIEDEDIEDTEHELAEVIPENPEPVNPDLQVFNNLLRSGGSDCSEYFKIDDLMIKIDDFQVYYFDGQGASVSEKVYTSYGTQRITFTISWSAKNSDQDTFKADDYLMFEICKVSGDLATILKDATKSKILYDKNDKTLALGTGEFVIEKVEDGVYRLLYKVIFNDNIVGKQNISGTMDGGATIAGTGDGEKVKVNRGEESLAEITKKTNDSGTKPVGPGYQQPIPEVNKYVKNVNDTKDTITWAVDLTEFAEQQFIDYEAKNTPNYSHFIFEDILDSHQTFSLEDYYNGGAYALVNVPLYVYDMEGLDDRKYISFGKEFFNLGTMSETIMKYVDSAENSNAETYVKETAKTWTIIKEQDGQGNPRERMIVNFGGPGNGGLKYSDLKDYTLYLDKMKKSRDYAEAVLKANADKGDSYLLEEEHGFGAAKATWKKWYRLISDTYDYYLGDPYVYAVNLEIITKVLTKQLETATASSVKNSYRLSGEYTAKEDEATQANFWSGTINAEVVFGDVVVYKADSLYQNSASELESYEVLGTQAGVEFQVFKENEIIPLRFDYLNGKYAYNENGNLQEVESDEEGRLILGDLLAGDYYLKEVSNPDGYYQYQNQRFSFSVNKSQVNYELVENVRRGIRLLKIDEENPETTLTGAEFKLFRYTEEDFADAEEVVGFSKETISGIDYLVHKEGAAEPLITDEDGKLEILGLSAGKYYLQEVVAPVGYVLSDEKYLFELDEELDTNKEHLEEGILNIGKIGNKKEEPDPKTDIPDPLDPADPQEGKSISQSPRTGDYEPVVGYGLLVVMAAAIIATVTGYKRKRR